MCKAMWVVLVTFVCPSGSPHTHWSAALRLIGHSDKKYRENHPLSQLYIQLILNFISTLSSDSLDTRIRNTTPFSTLYSTYPQLYSQLYLNFVSTLPSDLLDTRIRNTGASHLSSQSNFCLATLVDLH